MECGKGSAMGPGPSGAASAAAGMPGAGGMEIGTGEINTLESPKSGTATRSWERDKPQRGRSHHVGLK